MTSRDKPNQFRREFTDLPTGARIGLGLVAATEVVAKIAALRDIAKRPAEQVRGPKWAWALAQAVNGFGPAAYFAFGRRHGGK